MLILSFSFFVLKKTQLDSFGGKTEITKQVRKKDKTKRKKKKKNKKANLFSLHYDN